MCRAEFGWPPARLQPSSNHSIGTTMTISRPTLSLCPHSLITVHHRRHHLSSHFPTSTSVLRGSQQPQQLPHTDIFHLTLTLTFTVATIGIHDSHFLGGIFERFRPFSGQPLAKHRRLSAHIISSLYAQSFETTHDHLRGRDLRQRRCQPFPAVFCLADGPTLAIAAAITLLVFPSIDCD